VGYLGCPKSLIHSFLVSQFPMALCADLLVTIASHADAATIAALGATSRQLNALTADLLATAARDEAVEASVSAFSETARPIMRGMLLGFPTVTTRKRKRTYTKTDTPKGFKFDPVHEMDKPLLKDGNFYLPWVDAFDSMDDYYEEWFGAEPIGFERFAVSCGDCAEPSWVFAAGVSMRAPDVPPKAYVGFFICPPGPKYLDAIRSKDLDVLDTVVADDETMLAVEYEIADGVATCVRRGSCADPETKEIYEQAARKAFPDTVPLADLLAV
jgi:hypothetical protein